MIDISDVLGRLAGHSAAWSEEAAVETAGNLARSVGAVVDWDDEAGEEWLSVLLQGVRVAMVSTRLPLVVSVVELSARPEIPSPDGRVISVPSFDDPVIRCDIAVLGQAFGGEGQFRTLNAESFSANDLWFATV
ncbi:hypothetical protein [Streptomyces sp. NBC_01235]|uniref:hypothetical protein n=1 Tax=Streptomyces sp. NBC_01235 TaxID=2903788 RepID=UPI002E12FA87|nr:hypothetical protein OG289_12045 [Streptomyces sp. NBC_01235]